MKNRRVVITRPGGPEVLELISEAMPEPRSEEAQVRVIASGVAYGDVFKRRGLAPGSPKLPFTPGYDLVGVVEKVGRSCGAVQPGDRVAAFVMNGANTEWANVPASKLVKVPEGVDSIDALCVVLNYVTAQQMLHRVARIQRGERILIHGAAGGVGTALLQLGKHLDLEMYGTASKPKHGLVKELGGTPIDYKAEDFVVRIRDLTRDGVDVAFDPIGGSNVARSRSTLRAGGRLVIYGMSSAVEQGKANILGTFARLALYKMLPDRRRYSFYGIHNQQLINEDLHTLLTMLDEKKLRPIVGARLPIDECVKAHQMIEASAVSGKIVLVNE